MDFLSVKNTFRHLKRNPKWALSFVEVQRKYIWFLIKNFVTSVFSLGLHRTVFRSRWAKILRLNGLYFSAFDKLRVIYICIIMLYGVLCCVERVIKSV
jgi:uncharacterized pyridoxamine 5'-phosphate oxidase family protein